MQYIKPDITTICFGQAASAASAASGQKGKRLACRSDPDPPALRRCTGPGERHRADRREIQRMKSSLEEVLAYKDSPSTRSLPTLTEM